jgi:hypothetical protein
MNADTKCNLLVIMHTVHQLRNVGGGLFLKPTNLTSLGKRSILLNMPTNIVLG